MTKRYKTKGLRRSDWFAQTITMVRVKYTIHLAKLHILIYFLKNGDGGLGKKSDKNERKYKCVSDDKKTKNCASSITNFKKDDS